MKLRILGLSLILLFATLHPAHAFIVNTSIGTYEVTTITGTYNELSATLMGQVWYDDIDLATEFAGLVLDEFGFPNFGGDSSPWFLYETNIIMTTGADVEQQQFAWYGNDDGGLQVYNEPNNQTGFDVTQVYAVASPVPVPAAAWLFGSALLGLVGYSRRKVNA